MLYGIEVYGSACNEHMNKLHVQQNRSLRVNVGQIRVKRLDGVK